MSGCLVVAELGVNANGSRDTLLALVRAAHGAGASAIKVQCRTPELHADPLKMRESCTAPPGELISELEHRRRLELSDGDLWALHAECRRLGLIWFASCWDIPSLARMRPWDMPYYKLASASVTDLALVRATRQAADETGATVIASTGATTEAQCDALMDVLGTERTVLCHCVMGYPIENDLVNALCMLTLGQRYKCAVGYSGHERGVQVSTSLVAMGAAARYLCPGLPWGPAVIERHLTLDRSMRGSDHAASLEPGGFAQLVRDVRVIEAAMGDGAKRVLASEEQEAKRLRRAT